MIVLDGGTTWSKVIESESDFMKEYNCYLVKKTDKNNYYILPSSQLKKINFKFDKATGHMVFNLLKDKNGYENEVMALIRGFQLTVNDENSIVLDMGSRDSKWAAFKNGNFKDLDWNSSCSSSTGATVEMLLKFYNINPELLEFSKDKYIITCGIFGLEKIMDDIAKGEKPETAIARFIHGIAYNAWCFAKKPKKMYLSGGFCENKCFVDSLKNYCETVQLGRFLLCEGLLESVHTKYHS